MLQWSHASSRVETAVSLRCGLRPTSLQWSHASSRVETSGYAPEMRGWLVLQWSHASSRVETSTHPSPMPRVLVRFNGATRLHAWKLLRQLIRDVNKILASMEPRVFTRG